MVRIARTRISDLFSLAEREASGGHGELADRYVELARKVGMRYNVRLPPEYRELYCRGCSAFWVEGRTVRSRVRGNRRVRTCLRCGRSRRTLVRPSLQSEAAGLDPALRSVPRDEGALAILLPEEETGPSDEEPEEE